MKRLFARSVKQSRSPRQGKTCRLKVFPGPGGKKNEKQGPATASKVELMVKGIASFAYAMESSDNMITWNRGSTVTFLNDGTPLRHPATPGIRFFRVVWVNQ